MVVILLSSECKELGSPEARYNVRDGRSVVQKTEMDERNIKSQADVRVFR